MVMMALYSCCPVLSPALDLVGLSETRERRWSWDRRSPLGSRREGRRCSPRRKKQTDETELIQVETEELSPGPLNPERISLDSGADRGLDSGADRGLGSRFLGSLYMCHRKSKSLKGFTIMR